VQSTMNNIFFSLPTIAHRLLYI